MTTGGRIKRLRERLGLSQKDLAEKVGLNNSVLNRIELDTRPARADELAKIANALETTTDYLSLKTNMPTINLTPSQRKLIDKIDLSDEELLSFPVTLDGRELSVEEKKRAFKLIRALLEEDRE